MFRVSTLDLEDWSKTYAARADLPLWISRLIWASCEGLRRLDMPGGELADLGGFDGLIDCDTGNDMVPSGQSGWELSVEKAVKGKADDDYEKRTQNPGQLQKDQMTFVFATPCRWARGDAWAASKTDGGGKAVEVRWCQHLAMWFDRVPWIAAAFLKSIGKGQEGIESAEMIW